MAAHFVVKADVSYLDGEDGISNSEIAEVLLSIAGALKWGSPDKSTLTSAGEYVRYEITQTDESEID